MAEIVAPGALGEDATPIFIDDNESIPPIPPERATPGAIQEEASSSRTESQNPKPKEIAEPSDPRDNLCCCLEDIRTGGSFASFKVLPTLNLGLVVEDVGTIAMPLQEAQARLIIDKARQAPYGRGEETVVDTSVRNTWELDASQFELQGAQWKGLLVALLEHVRKVLGVAAPIHAELYKMLLYEQGAMFKAHTDSPKIPGMFGTLVIVLPSAHQGGDVIVRHRGEKKVFASSQVTQGFMTWYSDVKHEVLPVTSGYRWVLTYNMALADPSKEPPAASQLDVDGPSRLVSAVRRWLDTEEGNPVWILDHDYTEARISLRDLKGKDLSVVRALRIISSRLPVDIYLAILEKLESGSCEAYGGHYGRYKKSKDNDEGWHSLIDVFNTKHRIKKLVDLGGAFMAQDVALDGKDVLVPECFDGAELEEIEFEEGFSGNQGGPSATHAYRVSGVVLLPRVRSPFFMASALRTGSYEDRTSVTKNLQSLLTYFSDKCQDPSRDQAHFLVVNALCEEIWGPLPPYTERMEIDKPVARMLLQAVVRMRNWDFLRKTAENAKQGFDSDFCRWIMEEVANGLPFADIKESLLYAVLSFPCLEQSLQAVTSIARPKPATATGTDILQDWAHAALTSIFDTLGTRILDRADGGLLISLCAGCYDVEDIQTRVLPLLEKETAAVSFVLGILRHISQHTGPETTNRSSWLSIYEHLSESLIETINIEGLADRASAPSSRPANAVWLQHHGKQAEREAIRERLACTIESTWLSGFYKDLLSLMPDRDFATTLMQKICTAAAVLNPKNLSPLWIPFLQQLLPILEGRAIPLSTPQYQQVFVAILDAFIKNYVGKEITQESRTLQRPTVPCRCMDCDYLNDFLADANQATGRFSVGKKRRQHLHNQLDGSNIDCQHTTEYIGSPQTLVVTKTFKQHDAARQQWLVRKDEAQKVLQSFPGEKLRTLLGTEYPRIFHMDDIVWSPWKVSIPEEVVVAPEPSVPLQARPGLKRKADEALDVVDLTGSD